MKLESISTPRNWRDLRPHPFATLTGFGLGIEMEKIVSHMRQNGYDPSEPIILLDEQILDGRHRHIAAQEADVVPAFSVYTGENPIAYIAKKLLRQHLNESQRASFGAGLLKLSSVTKGSELANLPTTQAEAAKAVNVSPRTMQDAVKVKSEGGAVINQKVDSGEMKVSEGAEIIRTVLCKRCARVGATPGCEKCEAARAKAAEQPKPKKPRGSKPKPAKAELANLPTPSVEHPADTMNCPTCKGCGRIMKAMFGDLFKAILETTKADAKANGGQIGAAVKTLLACDPPYTSDEVRKLPALIKKQWPTVAFTIGVIPKYISWVRQKGEIPKLSAKEAADFNAEQRKKAGIE